MNMRRRGLREPEGSGEDSFLDIVANLVGILVILITVIGVRARGLGRILGRSRHAGHSGGPDIERRRGPIDTLEPDEQCARNRTAGEAVAAAFG